MAHDDTQAAAHEGQHGLGLECAAAGHQAQALQRGALAERLEELGIRAEVGLLQPAGGEDSELRAAGGCTSRGGLSVQGPPPKLKRAYTSCPHAGLHHNPLRRC